ncbi:hypothetical protein BDV93DRAFT_183634 [Ceratobasidium sp. AG-I]|nr:hypothetical protein BDV93DRAFT_183634 [Ceratobasidium sp. AG-I]
MPSALAKARSGFRHRIQEITLRPTTVNYPIELEIIADGTPVYGLPVVAPGSPLRWDLKSHPCDVQPDSKIKLKIVEKHFPSQRNRVGYAEYLISDVVDKASIHLKAGNPTSQSMGFGSTIKQWDHGEPFAVGLVLPDRNEVSSPYLPGIIFKHRLLRCRMHTWLLWERRIR